MATDTMSRRTAPSRGAQGVRGAGQAPRARGVQGGRPPGPATVTSPRHTRPVTRPPATGTRPASTRPASTRPASTRPASARPRTRPARAPFLLLLVGLLGGALISLLVISTTLAQGSFRVTRLQQQNADLARQEQTLTSQVAQASNPAVIAAEATKLGMVQNPNLKFIDLKTGKMVAGKPTKADQAINVAGYNP